MKGLKLLLLPLCFCLLLSGCGGRSISDYTLVEGIGVDYDNGDTLVSIQYLNLAGSTGATDSLTKNITTVTTGKSANISDAIFSASKQLSQEIFFGQNKLVVFGSKYIRNDISLGLDYLLRSVDSRPDVIVATSDTTGDDIIRSTQHDARVPVESLYDLLKTGEENGSGAVVTVNDLLRLYSSTTSDIYLPVLGISGENAVCKGIAVFSNEKYVLTLDDDKTLAFLMMQGRVRDASMVVKSNSLGNVGVEIIRDDAKRYVTIDNGKIVFHCRIKAEIILDDIEKGITSNVNQKRIDEIEHLVSKKLKNDAISTLAICSNNGCDPLEIGKYLAKSNINAYNAYSNDWRNNLKSISFDVTTNVELTKINDSTVK